MSTEPDRLLPALLVALLVFGGLASAHRVRARANRLENVTLADLRDALLPKLLSGEIRVPEAEQLAGEAA